MSRLKQLPTRLSAVLIYAAVIAAAAVIASSRIESAASAAGEATAGYARANEASTAEVKPFFSLSTNRTFASNENPRLWLDHRGFESLDFRVYRINNPQHFFTQLSNPHQMGEFERDELAGKISRRPSILERLRTLKLWAYLGFRNYFRDQLKQNTRVTFNQKFRAADGTAIRRVGLNQADYARVPLLNPQQLVSSWREPLPPGNIYDRRLVPLGKYENGVYLVEAIGGDLRAYTIVVVTDLAMVEKASPTGDMLIYAVDRKTGAPRPDSQIEIVKAHNTVASGRTNAEGIFRSKVSPAGEADPEVEARDNGVMIFASQGENFAISDLESFYFGDFDESENLRGYIYTDRPIYRPNHTVYFKGIIRAIDDQDQYGPSKSKTATVTIKDSNDARVFEKELQLSKHGTFNGEFTLAEEAPLGSYNIEAETEEGSSGGSFEVGEYKKPEYKVSVSAAKRFVSAGTEAKFDINARYFFGAPVAGAEVQYYIYRSRYYPYFSEEDEPSDDEDEAYSEYSNYYSELMTNETGKLDASGHLTIDFPLPPGQDNDVFDFQYRLEAQVTDSSRRTIDGSTTVVATRGNVIARANPIRYVYTSGQTAKIDVSTTDYQGRPVTAKVLLKFMWRNWVKVEQKENEYDPDYKMVETQVGYGEVTTNQEGHGSYNYAVKLNGSITIQTVVYDRDKQYTSLGGYIWVVDADKQWLDAAYYRESFGSIKLVPDKKSYVAGETAHVLAILPKDNANLLVTTERSSVMSARQVKAAGQTVVIDVPIEAKYAPNVFLSVTFVQNGDMYTSDQRLVVPARDKLLNLEVISNKQEYKPRETASYTILARDADGAPVPDAEVSLGVVDEAIYSVSPDYSGNIRQEFYGRHYNAVDTHLSISYSFIGFAGEKPMDIASTKPSYQLADFKNESDMAQPLIRKQFKDTAFWEPSAITGSDGRATVKFRLPDNLTTWRATARAVTADTRVGVARQKVIHVKT